MLRQKNLKWSYRLGPPFSAEAGLTASLAKESSAASSAEAGRGEDGETLEAMRHRGE